MNRNAQIGRKWGVLDRIVVVLLALADLAERAAAAPWPIRWLVLWALRYADAIAKEFVAGSAYAASRGQRSPVVMMVRDGSDPAAAFAIAVSLRMLAITVRRMAALFRREAFLLAVRSSDERNRRPRLLLVGASSTPQPARLDTS